MVLSRFSYKRVERMLIEGNQISSGIVRKHPSHAALARIGCHAVVDSIVHTHRMGHLLGESALEVDVVIDYREILP